MPRLHSATAALIALSVAVGCGPTLEERMARIPAPPPEDSGADRPVIVDAEKREEGNGFPDRLHAGLARVVRGEVEVRVESVSTGERLGVSVSVRIRGGKAIPFGGWTDPAGVTLRDPEGREYPLVALTAEQLKMQREWEVTHPEQRVGLGAGEVTRSQPRLAELRFADVPTNADYLDLDLSGAAVGFKDPIRFRIPQRMVATPGIPMMPGKAPAP